MQAQHRKFFDRLSHHDWFYMMADDNTSWRAGMKAEAVLRSEAATDPVKQQMYDLWSNWAREAITRDIPRPSITDFKERAA